jgi:hypothetical protein
LLARSRARSLPPSSLARSLALRSSLSSFRHCCPGRMQIQDFAVRMAQSCWRMYAARADFQMYRQAASLIQSVWKGRRLRGILLLLQVRRGGAHVPLTPLSSRPSAAPTPSRASGIPAMFVCLFVRAFLPQIGSILLASLSCSLNLPR